MSRHRESLLPDSRVHMWHALLPKSMQRRRTFIEWLLDVLRGRA